MKQLFAIIVFSIAATAALFCAETADTAAVHGADLSIRFFERTIYYPGNSPAEPVLVQVSLSNNTPQPLRFKMADDHFYSLDFSALTTRNLPLDHTEVWLRSRSSSRQIYFREVSLEPGESLSFTVDVKDFLDIPTPGMYILQCHFYPELKRLSDESEQRVSSNKLTLEVKPSPPRRPQPFFPYRRKARKYSGPNPCRRTRC